MLSNTFWGSAVAGILALVSALPAQRSQEDLIAARDEKLHKPVFQKARWLFDYDAARAEAKRQGKLLFTYFSRSYAY